MHRAELITNLTALVGGYQSTHTVRVAVNGPDAAGKSTLADELATTLRQAGRPALRISFDDFPRPRQERYRRGALSAEGYFRDSFDYDALRRLVLDPLGPTGDGRYQRVLMDFETETPYQGPAETAPPNAVLLVDGVFLLTDELRPSWELSVFVDIAPAETLRRALVRDVKLFGTPPDVVRERYMHRYLPGQQLYRIAAKPTQTADVVIENDDPDSPVITKWPQLGAGA